MRRGIDHDFASHAAVSRHVPSAAPPVIGHSQQAFNLFDYADQTYREGEEPPLIARAPYLYLISYEFPYVLIYIAHPLHRWCFQLRMNAICLSAFSPLCLFRRSLERSGSRGAAWHRLNIPYSRIVLWMVGPTGDCEKTIVAPSSA